MISGNFLANNLAVSIKTGSILFNSLILDPGSKVIILVDSLILNSLLNEITSLVFGKKFVDIGCPTKSHLIPKLVKNSFSKGSIDKM